MGSDTLLETNANEDENANANPNENDEQTNRSANEENDDHQMDSVAANFAFALGLDSMVGN
jgi:anthranilate phosphoribosyltransferase